MRLEPGTVFHVEAVLLDMDGTLIDTSRAAIKFWREWAERSGADAAAVLAFAHGRRTIETVRRFAPTGIDLEAEVERIARRELSESEGVVPVPGASSLLRSLPPDRMIVVTSASRRLAEARFAQVGLEVPKALVSGDEVQRGKPDPECYRLGAHRLGLRPEDCLVIDDAASGLTAGRAAGAHILAVATNMMGAALDDWPWLPDLSPLKVERDNHGGLHLRVVG